jgi:flotillin
LVKAEAEASRIRTVAQAEADAIRWKGEAEATNIRLMGEAYASYGDAALAVQLIAKLPEIAAEVSKPLAKTEKMVFIGGGEGGSGGGPAAFTRSMTEIMGQLPQVAESLTGFDLRGAMERLSRGDKGTLGKRAITASSEDQVL